MADTKISALAVGSALAGTEVFPVVQSSATKKSTIADILTYAKGQANTWALTQTFSGAITVGTTFGAGGAATFGGTLAVTGVSTFGTAPSVFATYSMGTRREQTAASGSINGAVVEAVADPSGASSAITSAVLGYAATKSGNAQNLSSSAGLVGFRAGAAHIGSGALTGMIGFYAHAFSNTGGGSVAATFGLYLADQTVGTTNYGVYQLGAAVQNYMAGKLAIGTTSPDATAIADLRGVSTQIAIGSATKNGYVGANNSIGLYTSWRATHDGTNWTARGTNAAIYLNSATLHRWYIDFGLTDGNTFTPTQVMQLDVDWGGQLLVGSTAPTVVTSNSYGFGIRPNFTSTSGSLIGSVAQALANPSSNSTAGVYGSYSAVDTVAGNASSITSLIGSSNLVRNLGDGAITNAYVSFINSVTNTGAGSIANVYGMYIAAQSAGTINWGIYSVDSQNFFACTTRSPLRFGNTTSNRGYMTANTSVGAVLSYVCEHDGTNWIARNTVGGAIRINHSSFDVLLDASGLTLDTAYTPTSRFSVSTSVAVFAVPVKHPSYTLAGLPSAGTSGAGAEVYCADHTGGARPVYSDGTNWRDYRTGNIAA